MAFLFKSMTKEELKKILDKMYTISSYASSIKEIPVSCCLINGKDSFFSINHVERENNPFSHAEINCLNKALRASKSKYLKDSIMIVSLEPCLMCMGAILKARIKELYYVQDDPDKGALSHYHVFVDDVLKVNRIQDERFNSLMNRCFKDIRKK